MDSLDRNLRRTALARLAHLAAASPAPANKENDIPTSPTRRFRPTSFDFERLEEEIQGTRNANGFMNGGAKSSYTKVSTPVLTSRDIEIVLALCGSVELTSSSDAASKLFRLLSPYLLDSPFHQIEYSPQLRHFSPSPWESLTTSTTDALTLIGVKFSQYRETVVSTLNTYLKRVKAQSGGTPDFSDDRAALPVAILVVSLLGFFNSASKRMELWTQDERIDLIRTVREILSQNFLLSAETAFSTIRNSHDKDLKLWKRYTRQYAASGRPLGAMVLQQGFTSLLAAATSLLVADPKELKGAHILDVLLCKTKDTTSNPGTSSPSTRKPRLSRLSSHSDALTNGSSHENNLVFSLFDMITEILTLVEDGADYLQVGSAWQQRLAFSVKAYAFISFCNCVEYRQRDSHTPDEIEERDEYADILVKLLESSLEEPIQMVDQDLAKTVLKIMAIVGKNDPSFAVAVIRLLPRYIVRSGAEKETVRVAGKCLARVLQTLSQDAIITTLYTLGNVLSSGNPERALAANTRERMHPEVLDANALGSAISLSLNTEEEKFLVYERVIEAIVGVACEIKDEKMVELAASILGQKVGKINGAVDAKIIVELAVLALAGGPLELKSVLKLLDRLGTNAVGIRDVNIAGAVLEARLYMSNNLKPNNPLYDTYLVSLLECIINKGDIHEQDTRKQTEPESRTSPVEPPKLRFLAGSQLFLHLDIVQLAAREISQFLQPLAILLSASTPKGEDTPPFTIHPSKDVQSLFRNAWFNCVVHGFLRQSELVQTHEAFLRVIARHTPPLVSEARINHMESDMDLNTILRRGMNTQNIAEQKRKLSSALPTHDGEIRSLSYPKVIFLQAALLVESLRALEGDCSKILTYFVDPSFKHGDEATCMSSIASEVMAIYLRNVQQGNLDAFRAPQVARQLVQFFTGCCHRVEKVQYVSASCADRIITAVPSALCQKSSIFALLELLTLMWNGCLEAETDEYGWHSVYKSSLAGIQIELSDSYPLRKKTLKTYNERAKTWLLRVLDIAPMDVKGLLQKYLAKFSDENVFGHVSLGRSLAYDIGAAVPRSDPRLSTLDQRDTDINLASDFIAQYTIRQAYRYDDNMPEHPPDWIHDSDKPDHMAEIYGKHGDAQAFLTHLESRAITGKFIAISEVRDILRRTAGLLCQSHAEQSVLIQHFVGIPFAIFTKQSIKLGISLWMGVLNENTGIAPRILSEIARNWELTVRRKQGLFNSSFDAPDAFNIKMEYVPSDKQLLTKHQTAALNMLSPHLRLLQFLSSHFHASRHGDPNIIRVFLRLIRITLKGLKTASPHPLAREARFQFVLFSLQVLKYTPGVMPAVMQWKLKDQIFSAALSWFTYQPRWSYGGSRMQLKAESAIMKEVAQAVQSLTAVGNANVKGLELKQELLLLLLENEQARVTTWISPLEAPRKQQPVPGIVPRQVSDNLLVNLLQTAWNESPALAIQMISRFPSKRFELEVRKMMLSYPEKVVKIPEALYYILGDKLPLDVNFQLRYLLYWAPLNPISAATYLLPSYANNPFLLQYAVRALENHSIDVTFFYVQQFVQTLRYDTLGYMERWILETGKFSQLFAHQIIWNMKANAYKDENSEVPDPIKPTLDKVMDHLISSFSPQDRSFYEREFSFFGEVTSISGKLRPFIGASKEEKKQKIEEELRKIKVDVGVYLPSNPDGIVIGIDRKSGKPLQSHAKAPYMATFRVRKKPNVSVSGDDVTTSPGVLSRAESRTGGIGEEKWQACIFKVGDDCRQDMLALQLIAGFRSIFNSVGLDVFVFPYRVVATAPGCGVIEVLPDSISRDMLGREAVNGLYDYFTTKHGGEDSIKFQEARSNFVQSMAAYSVISYLLQFKDRHNGNIMIDGQGHIIHIDFGFCFDIAPGGITFERAPFKLTAEMVAVMGGSTESQAYRWFEELCVKSFLACRPYCEQLAHLVVLMLDSGLPCFKPETIQNFKARFVLDRSEKDAADFMRGLVKRSYGSYSTRGYDQFQLLTNGIPY
ncbi:hypothetical protein H072_2952 [Dactylellina haptotyla CBS 200.50]|uniref:1-phosphatidylinositol 4-kinase n=1 Tax=Dactylellina haptotyla (strain CBS 200.50) TaxID=1284197 RepID=S8APX2_DACHA|nr:hypothetical protein H072_2952 [Dactylellina haptotyla CBS 200.50]